MVISKGSIKQRSRDSWTIIAPKGRDPETGKYRQVWEPNLLELQLRMPNRRCEASTLVACIASVLNSRSTQHVTA